MNWCFWTVVLEKTLESPLDCKEIQPVHLKEISIGCSLEGMMLKLKLQYLATSCEELTHWKRLWCWEGLMAGGEGDDRGWDGWMASPTWWMWVWVNSGSWWWTWRPGVLQFMGLQRVGHVWVTELNWTDDAKNQCSLIVNRRKTEFRGRFEFKFWFDHLLDLWSWVRCLVYLTSTFLSVKIIIQFYRIALRRKEKNFGVLVNSSNIYWTPTGAGTLLVARCWD